MQLFNSSKLPKSNDPLPASSAAIFATNERVIEWIREIITKQELSETDYKKLISILSKHYTSILDEIFDKENLNAFKVLMHERTLFAFAETLRVIPPLEYRYKIFCNKLCYDYLKQKDRDHKIESILFRISKEINKDIIPKLSSLDIHEDLASHMALAMFSSIEELVNIKRLNRVIIHNDPEFMTEQKIVDIYSKLFTKVTKLFEGIMFDVLVEFWSEDEETIYFTINLAILDILESMPMEEIKSVLISYIGDREMVFNDCKVRFNIKAISSDYPRILEAIDHLERFNGLYFY